MLLIAEANDSELYSFLIHLFAKTPLFSTVQSQFSRMATSEIKPQARRSITSSNSKSPFRLARRSDER